MQVILWAALNESKALLAGIVSIIIGRVPRFFSPPFEKHSPLAAMQSARSGRIGI
jgi:hypothetical protein